MSINSLITRLCCAHSYEHKKTVILGVTMDENEKPTRNKAFHYHCPKCDKSKVRGGTTCGDRIVNPHLYTKHGWPTDECGRHLTINVTA